MRYRIPLLCLVLLALAGGAWVGVRRRIQRGALAGSAGDEPRLHQDRPPHGGTAFSLGDGQFNLELVRDPASGTLRVFILDGEMESYVRIGAKELVLEVQAGDRWRTLRLMSVADPATGETVGDSALFRTRADWLKGQDPFHGVIPTLAIRDRTFRSVAFRFPEGNGRPD